MDMCTAYVLGVVDVLTASGYICLPKDFFAAQVTELVINYLRTRPDACPYSAAANVAAALQEFSCKKLN
jgi:Rap1a immunity proteins